MDCGVNSRSLGLSAAWHSRGLLVCLKEDEEWAISTLFLLHGLRYEYSVLLYCAFCVWGVGCRWSGGFGLVVGHCVAVQIVVGTLCAFSRIFFQSVVSSCYVLSVFVLICACAIAHSPLVSVIFRSPSFYAGIARPRTAIYTLFYVKPSRLLLPIYLTLIKGMCLVATCRSVMRWDTMLWDQKDRIGV